MITARLTNCQSEHLLIFFAGWGMDEKPFSQPGVEGYDFWIVYDYSSAEELEIDSRYKEICIAAWSFGVSAAAKFIVDHPHLPITQKIAICGTHHPVDDRLGIPESIFRGTLEGLSANSLRKFYRRMCGSSEAFKRFLGQCPTRAIDNLANELRAIANLDIPSENSAAWDTVFVADNDLIIPTANQLNAWTNHPDVRVIQAPHMPDFDNILRNCILPKPLIAKRFIKASATYESGASIQRRVARSLYNKWLETKPITPTDHILEIGAGTGLLTRIYAPTANPDTLQLWDLAQIDPSLPGRHTICDAETAILNLPPQSLDAIVAASTIQWFNSPASFIAHALEALRTGGILALSTYGDRNFFELRPYATLPSHNISVQTWQSLLSSRGIQATITEETHVVGFDSPRHLLKHLQSTGVNIASAPGAIGAALRIIRADIRTLTYHPIYIIARK